MTEEQKTPETEEPTPATEGEQDVEGHKIGRPGGLQPELDGGSGEEGSPDGFNPVKS